MCFVFDERKRAREVGVSPLRGGRRRVWDRWPYRTLPPAFLIGKTQMEAGQRHLYLVIGGFAPLMGFMMGGVF